MPRRARLVVPGFPHHITQRGVRKQRTFFSSTDYKMYLGLLRKIILKSDLSLLTYCLMPNHIHAIAIPRTPDCLAKVFGKVSGQYAQKINKRESWQGHLWQARFYSVVMDERHTFAAIKYVEQNPVRAGLCAKAEQWPWSSAYSQIPPEHDLIDGKALSDICPSRQSLGDNDESPELDDKLRSHTRSGRPFGDDDFVNMLERVTGQAISRAKSGRPRKK